MGDYVDELNNVMPAPGNGRAKRARIDKEGNFVCSNRIYAYNHSVTPSVRYDITEAGLANDSLLAYGVVASDSTFDNGPLINQALQENGIVFIPSGVYTVKTTITVPSGKILAGTSGIASRLEFSNNTPGFVGVNMANNSTLRGFLMQCNSTAPVIDNTNSIAVSVNGQNVYIESVLMGNLDDWFATGISFNTTLSGCKVFNSRIHGVVTGVDYALGATQTILVSNQLQSYIGGTIVDTTSAGAGTLIVGNIITPVNGSAGNVAVGLNVVTPVTAIGNEFVGTYTTAKVQGAALTNSTVVTDEGIVILPNLPVADPLVTNQIWNNAGVLNIS